jgi:hypothetical protein
LSSAPLKKFSRSPTSIFTTAGAKSGCATAKRQQLITVVLFKQEHELHGLILIRLQTVVEVTPAQRASHPPGSMSAGIE